MCVHVFLFLIVQLVRDYLYTVENKGYYIHEDIENEEKCNRETYVICWVAGLIPYVVRFSSLSTEVEARAEGNEKPKKNESILQKEIE